MGLPNSRPFCATLGFMGDFFRGSAMRSLCCPRVGNVFLRFIFFFHLLGVLKSLLLLMNCC